MDQRDARRELSSRAGETPWSRDRDFYPAVLAPVNREPGACNSAEEVTNGAGGCCFRTPREHVYGLIVDEYQTRVEQTATCRLAYADRPFTFVLAERKPPSGLYSPPNAGRSRGDLGLSVVAPPVIGRHKNP